jgi:hypothetical protein
VTRSGTMANQESVSRKRPFRHPERSGPELIGAASKAPQKRVLRASLIERAAGAPAAPADLRCAVVSNPRREADVSHCQMLMPYRRAALGAGGEVTQSW